MLKYNDFVVTYFGDYLLRKIKHLSWNKNRKNKKKKVVDACMEHACIINDSKVKIFDYRSSLISFVCKYEILDFC